LTKPSSHFDPERLGQLITDSLTRRISLDEEVALTEWLSESKENLNIYLELQDEIAGKIVEENKRRKRKLFQKYLAIAASLILITTLCLLHFFKPKDVLAFARHSKLDNSSNGIILTLANGLNLNIDSINSPIRQGNMVLKKSGNEITYNSIPNYPKKEGFNSIRTMFGKQIKIVFQDGSKVWLNAGSTIHYPTSFNDKFRKVKITGEAFFEIAPVIDSTLSGNKVPFIVSTNGLDIIVKGTKFNVQAYENDTEIKASLIEGSIEVKRGNQTWLLEPGNQAILSNDTLKVIKEFENEEVLGWKKDMFVFQDLQIEPLMRQISRWYNVTVIYESENLITDRFTMSVPRSLPLDQLLNIIQSTSKVNFKVKNHSVIVSK
jgi:transmembrane sensor